MLGGLGWVREHVAAKRYTAPGREKVRRVPVGKAPVAEAAWSFEGSQSREVTGPKNGGGGMSAPIGAQVASSMATLDANDPSGGGLGVLGHYGMDEVTGGSRIG